MRTDEVDNETTIGVTTSGTVEEGIPIGREGGTWKMIWIGETKKVSRVGDRITEADDRFIEFK